MLNHRNARFSLSVCVLNFINRDFVMYRVSAETENVMYIEIKIQNCCRLKFGDRDIAF